MEHAYFSADQGATEQFWSGPRSRGARHAQWLQRRDSASRSIDLISEYAPLLCTVASGSLHKGGLSEVRPFLDEEKLQAWLEEMRQEMRTRGNNIVFSL